MVTLVPFLQSLLGVSYLSGKPALPNADSPLGSQAVAAFNNLDNIHGSVSFKATDEGQVSVKLDLHNLPHEGYPLMYHIHETTVPENGDCMGTLYHLNPNGGVPDCSDNEYCELGDLSKKYGFIDENPKHEFHKTFIEPFLSLNKSNDYSIDQKSVVIHFANNTRIACANLTLISEGVEN